MLDLGMAVDPDPPPSLRGNFGHHDFLILKHICHKMRSPLRSVTLSCNIKLLYVTLILLNIILKSVLLGFSLTVKAVPHESVIRTSQP